MHNLKLISASAGSGKTYSLTRMVLDAVASGTAPERIMAVTFTNKAAAELTERIRQKLVQPDAEVIRDRGIDASQLRAQAASLSDAYIGTVNSICARLLREFAFEAGLSPSIDILPEEESDRLFLLSVSRQIGEFYPRLADPARRLGRDGSGSGFQQKPDWKKDVQQIVDLARANGLSTNDIRSMAKESLDGLIALLGPASESVSDNGLLDCLEQALAAIEAIDDQSKVTGSAIRALRRCRHAISHGYALWSDWSSMAGISAGKRSGADACLDGVRDYALRVQHHPDLHRDIETLISGVFECAAEAMDAFDAYKHANGLMDFVDQESKVLALLDHSAVCQRLRERIDLVMVDEFQDTSPIQMALFTRLSALVDRSVWVGDQKQAIYGFRGADPELMDEVIANLNDDQLDVLEHSWRSRPELVHFANRLFEQAFAGLIPPERVRLHPQRVDHQEQSSALGIWHLHGSRKSLRYAALAKGIGRLLREAEQWRIEDRESGELRSLKASDIAVLCRTNSNCAEVAEALGEEGIAASYGRGSLFAAPVCSAVLAGMRLLLDSEDTLALTELVRYLPDHAAASGWLRLLINNPENAFESWRKDTRIHALLQLKNRAADAAPAELFHDILDLFGIRDQLFAQPDPEQAMANLDAMGELVLQYQDACSSRHEGASLPGLIYWLSNLESPTEPEGRGEQTVQVCSYHRSKGLEWPLVILADLDSGPKCSPFGLHVLGAERFDPSRPLANRTIRYWPEPLSGKHLPFTGTMQQSAAWKQAASIEQAERCRLMYVGITRARDYLILTRPASRKLAWLDALAGNAEGGLALPETDEKPVISIGDASFDCTPWQLSAEDDSQGVSVKRPSWRIPAQPLSTADHLPHSISPSSYTLPDGVVATIGRMIELGDPVALGQGADGARLGEAVHHFLGADHPSLGDARRQDMAACLLSDWGVDGALKPAQLIGISKRFRAWLSGQWPGAAAQREWPMQMRMNNQLVRGWIDMLVQGDAGQSIIDHKNITASLDELPERAITYAGQLYLYRQAVSRVFGSAAVETWIHFALQGRMVQVRFDG